MIHTTDNFFNKVAAEIRERYFAEKNHGNHNEATAIYAIELFNNGCLNYRTLITRLAKNCNAKNATIHNIVEKYIVSFGAYQYRPGKIYSDAKTTN